jgi:NNP family nitrate/nitrite transporter-like MFS transporter
MRRYSELKGEALGFLFLLWFLWFLNFSGRIIFSPILPLIEDEFLVTHARATSIFIFQSIGYGFAMTLSGFYSGRVGFKKAILLSFAISACTSFCVPFVKAFSAFYLVVFLNGFSAGIYMPAIMPLLREHFVERNWGKAISMYDSAASISIFSVPFIVLFLLHYFRWRGIFGILGVAFLVVLILFSLIGDELKIVQPHRAVFKGLMTRKSFWVMVIIMSVVMGANMGIYYILPLYLTKELFLGMGYANGLLGISRFGGIGVAIVCGFLVDRFNLRKIMFILMIISGFFTILLGIASAGFVGIMLFLQAIFITGIMPIAFICMAKLFDRETMSMAIGLMVPLSTLFGTGLIPNLLGLSGDLLSFKFGIIVLGILLTLISWLALSLKELEQA